MRPSRAVLSLLFVAALTALVVGMVVMALDFTRSARTAPLVIGLPTAAFLVIQVGRDLVAMVRGDRIGGTASEQEADRYGNDAMPDDVAERAEATVQTALATAQREPASTSAVGATLWVLVLALSIWLVGMMAAIPVFTIAFMRGFGRERWGTSIAFALGTTAFVYVFFILVLEISLYEGYLGGLLSLS